MNIAQTRKLIEDAERELSVLEEARRHFKIDEAHTSHGVLSFQLGRIFESATNRGHADVADHTQKAWAALQESKLTLVRTHLGRAGIAMGCVKDPRGVS